MWFCGMAAVCGARMTLVWQSHDFHVTPMHPARPDPGIAAARMSAMTPLELTCHPTTPPAVPVALKVGLQRSGQVLTLVWRLTADPARIAWPAPQPPGAADGLWQHTCFEAFLRRDDGSPAYTEFNFSPSGQWACYHFRAERERELDAPAVVPPVLQVQRLIDGVQLTARIELPQAADADEDGIGWRIGLSAVIETTDGHLSYWALHHPADRPDFHHPAGHVLHWPAE